MTFNYDVVVYLLGLACTAGIMVGRITALEKKVDKHNTLVERMYKIEGQFENSSQRIGKIEEALKNK